MNASAQTQTIERGLLSGSRAIDTEALLARARRAAAGLHDLGVWQGDQVALLLRNDFAFFEATPGAMLLGASPVPMNWHLTADEIAYILDDCGAKVLVAHADLLTETVLAVYGNVEVIAVETPAEAAAAYRIAPDRCRIPGGIPGWSTWLESYPSLQGSHGPIFIERDAMGQRLE